MSTPLCTIILNYCEYSFEHLCILSQGWCYWSFFLVLSYLFPAVLMSLGGKLQRVVISCVLSTGICIFSRITNTFLCFLWSQDLQLNEALESKVSKINYCLNDSLRKDAIMDFTTRTDFQTRSQTNTSGGRGKPDKNDSDAFMRLVSCIPPIFLVHIVLEIISNSPIVKSQDVSETSASTSLLKIFWNQIPSKFKKSSNGSPSY